MFKRFMKQIYNILIYLAIVNVICAIIFWLGWTYSNELTGNPYNLAAHLTKLGFTAAMLISVIGIAKSFWVCDRDGMFKGGGLVKAIKALGLFGYFLYFLSLMSDVYWR